MRFYLITQQMPRPALRHLASTGVAGTQKQNLGFLLGKHWLNQSRLVVEWGKQRDSPDCHDIDGRLLMMFVTLHDWNEQSLRSLESLCEETRSSGSTLVSDC